MWIEGSQWWEEQGEEREGVANVEGRGGGKGGGRGCEREDLGKQGLTWQYMAWRLSDLFTTSSFNRVRLMTGIKITEQNIF